MHVRPQSGSPKPEMREPAGRCMLTYRYSEATLVAQSLRSVLSLWGSRKRTLCNARVAVALSTCVSRASLTAIHSTGLMTRRMCRSNWRINHSIPLLP